jgi:hypothetical protein
MTWTIGTVAAPKRGCEEASYEDAYRIGLDASGDSSFRVAVSDGATESAFARLWANSLVDAFVHDRGWEQRLDDLARDWATDVWSRDLAWNVQEKASQGAHASLVGAVVSVQPTEPWQTPRWHAHASIFGDSCLFVLKPDGVIVRAEPYERPEQFDARPHLLSTSPEHRQRALQHRRVRRSHLSNDQLLVLSTDAIGQWMVDALPEKIVELITIATASNKPAFDLWLEEHRSCGDLKDDDCTVVTVARV